MRKWGVVVSLFYTVILLGLIIPGAALLMQAHGPLWDEFFDALKDVYGSWLTWFVASILVAGEAILLFLTVDTSRKRLKPHPHCHLVHGHSGTLCPAHLRRFQRFRSRFE